LWKFKSFLFFKASSKKEKTLIEDILKQLYHVEYSGKKAGFNDMAGALKMKDEKLLMLIEKATALNLINFEKEILHLTPDGRYYALRIIRVHRLWEKYLSEKTGIDKLEWHHSAEKMEHNLTAEEVDSIDRELGSPRFDPHGDPIPTAQGEIANVVWKPLSAFPERVPARIVHIEDEPEVIYKQIIAKKLFIGSQLQVLSSLDTLVTIYSEGKEYSFTPIVAANISVVELNRQEVFEENSQRLSELAEGEPAKVLGISSECRGANRRRLLDLGFIPGTEIVPEFSSPMKDPKAYLVRNTLIALRDDQAELILIEKV
jgi:DtxR family Mn-dependent transcriptional regulator